MRQLEHALGLLAERGESISADVLVGRLEAELTSDATVSDTATMHGQDSPSMPTTRDALDGRRRRNPWRGPLIAAGTAVAILVVVSLSLLFIGNGTGDVVIEPAPTTTLPANQDETTATPAPIVARWSHLGTVDNWLTEPVLFNGSFYATRKGLGNDARTNADGVVEGHIEESGELWTSVDGVNWVPTKDGEQPPPASPDTPDDGPALVVRRNPMGDLYGVLVAEGLWATSDGTSWREIELRPSEDNWTPWVATGGLGWVVYSPPQQATVEADASSLFQGPRHGNLGLWYTPDTEAWFEIANLGPLADVVGKTVDNNGEIIVVSNNGEVGVRGAAMIVRDTDILVYVNIATTAGFDISNPHTEIWRLDLPTGEPTTIETAGWSTVLADTRAKAPPTPAACPPSAAPNTPGPPDQARPGESPWNNQAAVFDTRQGRIVYLDETGETWTFDVCTNTWHAMNPTGAPYGDRTVSREFGELVYDVDSDRTIAFGPYFVTVYDANTNSWTQQSEVRDSDLAFGRPGFGAVYDPVSGLVVVQTGEGLIAYDVETDTWTPLGQLSCSPNMVYDALSEQWSPADPVPGCTPFLIGYSAVRDRLIFLGFQEGGLIVDPRTGESTDLDEPPGGVMGGFGSFRYATSGDTAYTYGEHVCTLDPDTFDWDCSPRNDPGYGPGAMVYDPINTRVVVISAWAGSSVPDDVWAIDMNTSERFELLDAANTRCAVQSSDCDP